MAGSSEPGVLEGAAVVVDVSAPPSCGDAAAAQCFAASTRSLLGYAAAAGVKHHVALSSVGAERLPESGYFQARCAQEQLIKEWAIPYRSCARRHASNSRDGRRLRDDGASVHVPPVLVQPVAADDVVRLLASVATADAPLNGAIELGGPEPFPLDGLISASSREPRSSGGDAPMRTLATTVRGWTHGLS